MRQLETCGTVASGHGASDSGRAHGRLVWGWGVTALVLLTVLLFPARAGAGSFRWNVDGGGAWDNRNNWVCDAEPCRSGFPDAPGDEAKIFVNLTSFAHDILLPSRPITVGTILINSNASWGFVAFNATTARLILNNTVNGTLRNAEIVRVGGGSATDDAIHVPVELQGGLTMTVLRAFDTFAFRRAISGVGDFTVGPFNAGTVWFKPVSVVVESNSYRGTTTVASGILQLGEDNGPIGAGLPGALVVGDGSGLFSTAQVLFKIPFQFEDASAPVTVNRDGNLAVNVRQRAGDVTVNGGLLRPAAAFEVGNLTLNDGRVEVFTVGSLELHGNVTVSGTSRIHAVGNGFEEINLLDATRTFTVAESGFLLIDNVAIRGLPGAGLIKEGPGEMQFLGTRGTNTYSGETRLRRGTMALIRNTVTVPRNLVIGGGADLATLDLRTTGPLGASTQVSIASNGRMLADGVQGLSFMDISAGGLLVLGNRAKAELFVDTLTLAGGQIVMQQHSILTLRGELVATSGPIASARIDGSIGQLNLGVDATFTVRRGPQPIDLVISANITDPFALLLPAGRRGFTLQGGGIAQLAATNFYSGQTVIQSGTLLVDGASGSPITVTAGVLGGSGLLGAVSGGTSTGTISPGFGTGRLTITQGLALRASNSVAIELEGLATGASYDQLDVRGPVDLGGATLTLLPAASFAPTTATQLLLVLNDRDDPVIGTFAGLAEGATITLRGREFTLSYHGGDGNDVVLTAKADSDPTDPPAPTDPPGPIDPPAPTDPPAPPAPTELNYFLSEGATGAFFDMDILIANPNQAAAPVTLTFSKENGEQVVATRVVPARAHLTVPVDRIPGLEAGSASVRVRSDERVPLFVERSMFWDAEKGPYYAGHTGGAVERPARQWYFAEGSQGSFFDTFVLVNNPNATPTDVTFTFFREGAAPIVKTVSVGAATRLTLSANVVPEIRNQSFGLAIEATQPIMAERSMYFGNTTARTWSGGTESAGVTAPSRNWFLAEGATGTFFTTYVLLSNPQAIEAHVTLKHLLLTGEVVTVDKTLAANARSTVNIGAEDDARLRNAAMSTVVTSDVPIIAERSMYWLGAASPWGEGHNSFGVTEAGTRWGLAEGRTGGPLAYRTYILLANPQTTAATVRVTYLRETGASIVETYDVAPTSRFNIDTNTIAGLEEAAFGALIEVVNDVPIVVERSLYWDAHGFQFSGGTNATGIRLAVPVPE